MKEAYCSYEVYRLLKEKGFKSEDQAICLAPHHNDDGTSELYPAITHQMACDWIEKTYKYFIEVYRSIDLNGNYHYSYSVLNKECRYIRKGCTNLNWNHEDAVDAALKYTLKII